MGRRGESESRFAFSIHTNGTMFTMPRVTLLLRAVIAALFALLVMFETLSMPGQFLSHEHRTTSERLLDLSLTAVAIFWALSLQAALVVAWRMLTFAQSDRIFSQEALVPMTFLVRLSGLVATTVGITFLGIASIADDPGLPVMLMLLLLCVTTAWLVMYVLRDVLKRAVQRG